MSLRVVVKITFISLITVFVTVFVNAISRAQDPCSSPANAIVAENCQTGNPRSEWDISGNGEASIQSFTTTFSVNKGEVVHFKIKTDATSYRLDIYRMGYYGGMGARKVNTVNPSVQLPQTQPNCQTESSTGLVDCGNWAESATWSTTSATTSGIYFAKLVRTDGVTGTSHILFIVRDDGGAADLLFQTSDTTWQAYNNYGGKSLYENDAPTSGQIGPARAYKVSYNRPFNVRGPRPDNWVFNAEYPMVRWLERNGYSVSYFTGVDSAQRGTEIRHNHKVFLSVGHDEYWSSEQRSNVEAARDAGVHLAFFSGNDIFWKTRWENDAAGSSYRTLVTYKETYANPICMSPAPPHDCGTPTKIDPASAWTGTWRDPHFLADGHQPENNLSGTMYTVEGNVPNILSASSDHEISVPSNYGQMRFWRNTAVASLTSGSVATLAKGSLGFEWNSDIDNGFRPHGLIHLSSTTLDVDGDNNAVVKDYGIEKGAGRATHNLTIYRKGNALVFSAGTIQWSWGLDCNHDRGSGCVNYPANASMQATVNLFADMAVQPATLQTELLSASASNDTTAPSSTITSPSSASVISSNSPFLISGTASDVGGIVSGVEVSVDGGTTWHPATGRNNWSYVWTPGPTTGNVTIKSRAVDDSANLESASSGITVTVVNSRSLLLNGSTAYAQIPAPVTSNLNVTGPITVEAWIKTTPIHNNKASSNAGTMTRTTRTRTTAATHCALIVMANSAS